MADRGDYQYCEQVIRQHSKSFYAAFSTLPELQAQAVYAVYAFCRAADDAVDQAADAAAAEANLCRVESQLRTTLEGQSPDEPLWRALAETMTRWSIPPQPFFDQLDGQRTDLRFEPFATLDALERYCDLVAGSVGRMLLPILSRQVTPALNDAASQLGIAMQITNILRDVGEDLRDRGRIYLPLDLMQRYHVTDKMLAAGKVTAEFTLLWQHLRREAEPRYDRFLSQLALFDPPARLPLAAAVMLYRAILDAVAAAGCDCLTRRCYVSKPEQLRLLRLARKKAASVGTEAAD